MNRVALSRRGFTLVELLVVIAIIGVLVGLLLPAVQSAREAGRRVTCTNNQYQIALAASRFNDANGFLPGWKNFVPCGSGTTTPSWTVAIFPFIERMDIYRAILNGTPPSSLSTTYVAGFVCPSTPPDTMTSPTLAYAGNCGTYGNPRRSDGVMLDSTVTVSGSNNGRVALDDIANGDGTANTLLISEQCGPLATLGSWNVVIPATTGTSSGFGTPSASVPPSFGIPNNADVRSFTRIISGTNNFTSAPSSNHPGGAVAAFCDGHTVFLKDSLGATVYAQLITSNNSAASTFITGNTTTQWKTGAYVLSEGDFQ
jgi:prepilin-type N-terminal cleavage/methylation domain-containing protein/prepilin-type processing-associated H-X9-DG protein